MGWYPGIIGSTTPGGGFADLMALFAGDSNFDLDDSITNTTVVAKEMFKDHGKIKSVNLSTVEIIDEGAFKTCGAGGYGNSVNLLNCKAIYKDGFSGFKTLISSNIYNEINLPECTILSQRAFGNSTQGLGVAFESVFLPKIESIGDYCFQNGTFGTITLGSSCSTLGITPFLTVTLSSLYCEATTPPVTSRSNLGFESIGAIYVPQTSVTAYQTATGWSAYASKIEAIPV